MKIHKKNLNPVIYHKKNKKIFNKVLKSNAFSVVINIFPATLVTVDELKLLWKQIHFEISNLNDVLNKNELIKMF